MTKNHSSLTESEHRRILEEEILQRSSFTNATPQSSPKAVVLAGQPGAGKGALKIRAESEFLGNAVSIDPDELRDAHPKVEQLRERYPYTWAEHTHADASAWAKELRAAAIAGKKNLILDTTLGNGTGAVSLIRELKEKGYDVEVRVMATHQFESELGVHERFGHSLETKGYGRYVPSAVRRQVYEDLPRNLDKVQAETGVAVRVFNREGVSLYDSRLDSRTAGAALAEARQARLQDPLISQRNHLGWKQQLAWQHDLPGVLPTHPVVGAETARSLLFERRAMNVEPEVSHLARSARLQDFDVRIRPPLYRAGSVLGGAATAYDAADTARSTRDLLGQGNVAGAHAGVLRFGTRNAGGWAGAWAGMQLGALAGVETGPGAVVTALIGGAAGAVGGEKVADWVEHHRINTQADGHGQRWHFDPAHPERGWTRSVRELDVEATAASLSEMPIYRESPSLTADAALARQLDYQAASMAVQLRLASPDLPVDPYRIPADAGDSRSVRESPWLRDPATGHWRREVADGLLDARVLHWRTETASPTKREELDIYAERVLAYNAERSPAALAARYARVHEQMGWADLGPVPGAVQSALREGDTQLASDGARYRRQEDGRWVSPGFFYNSVAEGNLHDELDAARRHQRALPASTHAPMPAASSPESMRRLRNADAAFLDAYCDALGRGDHGACQRAAEDYERSPQARMFLQPVRDVPEPATAERHGPEREPSPPVPVQDAPAAPMMRR